MPPAGLPASSAGRKPRGARRARRLQSLIREIFDKTTKCRPPTGDGFGDVGPLGARVSRPHGDRAVPDRRTGAPGSAGVPPALPCGGPSARLRAGRPRSQVHDRQLVPAMPGWVDTLPAAPVRGAPPPWRRRGTRRVARPGSGDRPGMEPEGRRGGASLVASPGCRYGRQRTIGKTIRPQRWRFSVRLPKPPGPIA